MAFVHRITTCDGRSSRRFGLESAALRDLERSLGWAIDDRGQPLRAGRTYYDDFGGRHVVEEVSRSVRSAATDEALGRAYDARECGIATKRQLALLDRHNL